MVTTIPGLDLIAFACPACELPIRVPSAFAGRRGSCPECEGVIRIPNQPGDDDDGFGCMDSATGPLPADAHALIPRAGSRPRTSPRPKPTPPPVVVEEEPFELGPTPWPKAALGALFLMAILMTGGVTWAVMGLL